MAVSSSDLPGIKNLPSTPDRFKILRLNGGVTGLGLQGR